MASTKKSKNGFSSQLRMYEARLALKAFEEGRKQIKVDRMNTRDWWIICKIRIK